MQLIPIGLGISIRREDIEENFSRSSGPGGQNVNKVETAVELRFNVFKAGFPSDMLLRLEKLAGRLLRPDGTLIITAQEHRTQERNRHQALEKLVALLHKAAIRPVKRIKTKPTKASQRRRLDTKTKHANLKGLRRQKPETE